MLCKDKITAIFCVIDDILKEITPKEDKRRKVSDSEIVITALIAAQSFMGIIVQPQSLLNSLN